MLRSFIVSLCLLAAGAFIALASSFPAHAAKDAVYTSWRNNLGAGGYDVVSFHQGNPIKGDQAYTAAWNGANWQFASRLNLDAFLIDPARYAPAYGGYCAWAVANDKLAKGDPEHWHVEDGVLYLNFNQKIQDRWLADKDNLIEKANARWPEILE